MARAHKPLRPSKPSHKSKAKSNAIGYANRHSRKPSSSKPGVEDVYEYETQKTRRSRAGVSLTLDRDEDLPLRNEDEDDDEGGGWEGVGGSGGGRPRLIGENVDDEKIDEEDDEEIDSDEAFEESDEERFAGFTFASDLKKKGKAGSAGGNKGNGKGKVGERSVRFAEVDLNEDDDGDEDQPAFRPSSRRISEGDGSDEDEDEEEEGEDDEFIDLLEVLDGRGDPDIASEAGSVEYERPRNVEKDVDENESQVDGQDGSEGDEQDDDDDDEGEDEPMHPTSDISPSDEEPDPEALSTLNTFITSLPSTSQKRKGSDHDEGDVGAPARKRRYLKEMTSAGMENEFGTSSGPNKLSLNDLLAPLASQSSTLLSLKKSIKPLVASSSSKSGPLSAPLPQRTQDRLDREAAYEQTKEEVDKWKESMKRIREADHLSFPLQSHPIGRSSNMELTAKFKPTTELESSVDKLLKLANLRESEISQTEELKLNALSIEEVSARRAELRKMRDLMFRAEIKAKRVAKIKSKTFRKIKKREKAKLLAKLDGGEGDGEDDDDDEKRMKREVERAKERATLRHKNTGKWAKAMKGRNELDGDQRMEMLEMLERGEKLRKKIRGEGSGSDDGKSDDDDEGGEGDLEQLKASAFEELAALEVDGGVGEEEVARGHKSIFNMKFMKDAMARDRQKADRVADDFVKEMGGVGGEGEGDEEVGGEVGEGESSGVAVQRVGGRVQARPGTLTGQQPRQLGSLPSDTSSVTLKSTDLPEHHPPAYSPPPPPSASSTEKVNPWLAPQTTSTTAPRKKNEVVVAKESASVDKSKNKLRKRMKKREEEKEKAKEDALVEISMDDVLVIDKPGASTSTTESEKKKAQEPRREGSEDENGDSEVEEQEKALERKGKKGGVKPFEQRDLVARAFAGDNVVQEFEAMKRKEMQEDAPHEVDTTLPGWGSWGGKGARRQAPKPHLIKKVAGVDPKSRADYNKAHVIISEKRDKKAAKYMVKDLPYPYTSKAQYERSIEAPIGTEWNTRLGFQRGTLPKVVKKMGAIINPLEKLS
ncbi:hypothetical protein JAAARDRAFT_202438 [Jaapia argillacea MUCL 33604]|uniref:Utp14-domain-containing protein n=1 Tax=Jaapia argillacea MUCL 33604 TaxID=933084 RepID=A0A067Q9R8_9AGAM|nr:hypothetical protein JAAARDRAFT_202438 [Jaapia argillacea MUCL 33604]